MFFPFRTDRPLSQTPYVNYTLILLNVLVFFATFQQIAAADAYMWQFIDSMKTPDEWARITREMMELYPVTRFYLRPDDPKAYQFFTSMFLHADIYHLLGNMLFLWVFGNNVEDRLGKVGYVFFYLAAGISADIGHLLTSAAPVLGASGAIAGVTGMFLALFPHTRITIFYFFFFIGMFEVPAMLIVMFYFLKDLLFWGAGWGGNVAYTAHLGGNLMGFAVGMTLLLTRILPREPYDLMSMWAHRRRREQFKKISRQGYQAWEGRGLPGQDGKELSAKDKAVIELREKISAAMAQHDPTLAAKLYRDMLAAHGKQTLSQRNQMDLANQLFAEQDHPAAAGAYAALLETYPRHPEAAKAQLMLGLLYARYLNRPADAKPLLQEASQRLDGEEAKVARQVLAEVSG
jgi:membrane associated rhomboid family serine protease